MNARAEAYERLEGRYETRVLEPSPPAVADGPWFADDPVARGEVPAGRSVVSPVGSGDVRWDELAATDAALAEWCADRWLGAYRRLGPAPPRLVTTRVALHRVAEQVVSPARRKANGKIGLRYTRGGFGTPFFGADVQVRVRGTSSSCRTRAASESHRSPPSPPRPITLAGIGSLTTSSSIASGSTSTRRPRPSSATGTGSPPRCSKSCARRPEAMSTPRACSCGQSTSTLRSSWAAKPRGPRRLRIVSGRRTSPRAVSVRRAVGRTRTRRSLASDRVLRRRASRTRNCSARQTSATRHWHSSARACARSSDDPEQCHRRARGARSPRDRVKSADPKGWRSARFSRVAVHAEPGDGALLCALRSGDEGAFARLVDSHHRALLRVAQLYVRDRAVAEEVVQETWLAVLEGIDRFEERSSLKTWIYRILTQPRQDPRTARAPATSVLSAHRRRRIGG